MISNIPIGIGHDIEARIQLAPPNTSYIRLYSRVLSFDDETVEAETGLQKDKTTICFNRSQVTKNYTILHGQMKTEYAQKSLDLLMKAELRSYQSGDRLYYKFSTFSLDSLTTFLTKIPQSEWPEFVYFAKVNKVTRQRIYTDCLLDDFNDDFPGLDKLRALVEKFDAESQEILNAHKCFDEWIQDPDYRFDTTNVRAFASAVLEQKG